MIASAPARWMQETAEAPAQGTGLRESLRLLDLPEMWVVVLVILPLFALICWLGYRGERLSTAWRFFLSGLRFLALAILLLVLFRPVLVQHREEVQEAEVIVLVDDSASMRRKDAYRGDPAQREALQAFATGLLSEATWRAQASSHCSMIPLPLSFWRRGC